MFFYIENQHCGDYSGSITNTKIQCWLNEDGTGEYFDFTNTSSVPQYALDRTKMSAVELCLHCQNAHKEAVQKYIAENNLGINYEEFIKQYFF